MASHHPGPPPAAPSGWGPPPYGPTPPGRGPARPPQLPPAQAVWRPARRDSPAGPRDTGLRSALGTVVACLVAVLSSLVAVAYAGNAVGRAGGSQLLPILGMVAGFASAAALVWRRSYPVQVCLGSALLALVLPLDAFAPLLALTWVIARRSRTEAWVCGGVAAAATGVSLWRDAARDGKDVIFSSTDAQGRTTYLEPVGYVVLGVLLVAVAVAAGLARRYAATARTATGVAQESARAAAELRTELTRQEERDLVAREMHDTVAHHLSLVSLQAAALESTAGDPATDVPAAARAMRDNAHRALEEMRALVASLRDASLAREPGPAPALAELPRLVDDARAAGADISATFFVADPDAAPAALTRGVYRVVQESLTNALKHAPGAHVEVDVRAGRGAGVDVVVRNRLAPAVPGAVGVPGGGAGLRGMSERANALGGTFEAGPADGWFTVRVHLPWSGGAAQAPRVGGRS